MTTDNTEGLNEITSDLWVKYGRPGTMDEFLPEARQAILDWHNKQVKNAVVTAEDNLDQYWNKELNKQIEEVLDRLLEHGEDFTTFGDGSRSVAVEYIQAERNKLKERTNDQL